MCAEEKNTHTKKGATKSFQPPAGKLHATHTNILKILTVGVYGECECARTSTSPSWSPPSSLRRSSERPELAAAALGAARQPLPLWLCHVTPCTKQQVPPTSFRLSSLPPST